MLAQPFTNPYTAILALYDNSGVLISVRMHSVKESPEENTLIFENITVPNIEYYKVALFRWNDIDGEFGMMPVAEPIFPLIHRLRPNNHKLTLGDSTLLLGSLFFISAVFLTDKFI